MDKRTEWQELFFFFFLLSLVWTNCGEFLPFDQFIWEMALDKVLIEVEWTFKWIQKRCFVFSLYTLAYLRYKTISINNHSFIRPIVIYGEKKEKLCRRTLIRAGMLSVMAWKKNVFMMRVIYERGNGMWFELVLYFWTLYCRFVSLQNMTLMFLVNRWCFLAWMHHCWLFNTMLWMNSCMVSAHGALLLKKYGKVGS